MARHLFKKGQAPKVKRAVSPKPATQKKAKQTKPPAKLRAGAPKGM